MSVYLLRHIESKIVHGFAWGSEEEVWHTIDEWCDPGLFEIAPVGPGALFDARPIEQMVHPFTDFPEVDGEAPGETSLDLSKLKLSPSESVAMLWSEVDELKWRSANGFVWRVAEDEDA